MKFRYIITQNNKEIAGFNDCNTAYIFKDFIRNANRMAGYKDRFQIIDAQAERGESEMNTRDLTLHTAIIDFSDELKDIENLIELIHLGITATHCSETDLEESALRIVGKYMESTHEKYISQILELIRN